MAQPLESYAHKGPLARRVFFWRSTDIQNHSIFKDRINQQLNQISTFKSIFMYHSHSFSTDHVRVKIQKLGHWAGTFCCLTSHAAVVAGSKTELSGQPAPKAVEAKLAEASGQSTQSLGEVGTPRSQLEGLMVVLKTVHVTKPKPS